MAEELFTTDRNKTELTHRLTAAAMLFLDEHGFKPVETEVPLDRDVECARRTWQADIMGVCVPTQTEARLLELIPKRPGRRATEDELEAWKQCYRSLPKPITALVEVKTSRADFTGDWKWKETPPVNLCYLAIPENMLARESYPRGWFVLEYSGSRQIKLAARGDLHSVSSEQQLRNVLALAVRRDHFTRHARIRVTRRAECLDLGEKTTVGRVSDAMRAVLSIVHGRHNSVDEALFFHNIKKKLPAETRAQLQNIWGLLKDVPVENATRRKRA